MKANEDNDKKKRRNNLRLSLVSTAKDTKPTAISVDAYSLAFQRRAIAYGRARGNV